MRNLLILTTAGGGAWAMGDATLRWGAQCALQSGLGAAAPVGGLLIVPALLFGALVGALVGGMMLPRF